MDVREGTYMCDVLYHRKEILANKSWLKKISLPLTKRNGSGVAKATQMAGTDVESCRYSTAVGVALPMTSGGNNGTAVNMPVIRTATNTTAACMRP